MSLVRRYWRDRALWTTIADVFAILAALTLPWSTTLPGIFVPCWLGAVAWVMDWRAYGRLLKLPICYLPLALVGLALVGTLWADATWPARLYAVSLTLKLLVLPGAVLSFRAVVARDVGVRRIPGVLRAADGDVVACGNRSEPYAEIHE
jgi:hypothetical protein